MRFTARELRAIRNYCERYNCRPSLASYPATFFIEKDTGTQVRMDISEVLDIYDENRREDARERKRQKNFERS